MPNTRLSLQLAERMLVVFGDSGATPVEQFAALAIARELVGVALAAPSCLRPRAPFSFEREFHESIATVLTYVAEQNRARVTAAAG